MQDFSAGTIGIGFRVANQDVFFITFETATDLECLLQLRASPMQSDLDDIQSQPKNFSDFLVGQPLDLAQCHYGAVILRQGVDVIVDARAHPRPHQLSFRRGVLFLRQRVDILDGSFFGTQANLTSETESLEKFRSCALWHTKAYPFPPPIRLRDTERR